MDARTARGASEGKQGRSARNKKSTQETKRGFVVCTRPQLEHVGCPKSRAPRVSTPHFGTRRRALMPTSTIVPCDPVLLSFALTYPQDAGDKCRTTFGAPDAFHQSIPGHCLPSA